MRAQQMPEPGYDAIMRGVVIMAVIMVWRLHVVVRLCVVMRVSKLRCPVPAQPSRKSHDARMPAKRGRELSRVLPFAPDTWPPRSPSAPARLEPPIRVADTFLGRVP